MTQPYRPALRRLTAPANPFESLESRCLLSTTTLDFNGGSGGLADSGFTAVLATSRGTGFLPGNVALSGGRLIVTTTAGDMVSTDNKQDDALDLPVDATRNFVLQTRLAGLPFNKPYQSGG